MHAPAPRDQRGTCCRHQAAHCCSLQRRCAGSFATRDRGSLSANRGGGHTYVYIQTYVTYIYNVHMKKFVRKQVWAPGRVIVPLFLCPGIFAGCAHVSPRTREASSIFVYMHIYINFPPSFSFFLSLPSLPPHFLPSLPSSLAGSPLGSTRTACWISEKPFVFVFTAIHKSQKKLVCRP